MQTPPTRRPTRSIERPISGERAISIDRRVSIFGVDSDVISIINELAKAVDSSIVWHFRPTGRVTNWRFDGTVTAALGALARSNGLLITWDGYRFNAYDVRGLERVVIDIGERDSGYVAQVNRMFPWSSAPLLDTSADGQTVVLTAPYQITTILKSPSMTSSRGKARIEVIRGGQPEKQDRQGKLIP